MIIGGQVARMEKEEMHTELHGRKTSCKILLFERCGRR